MSTRVNSMRLRTCRVLAKSQGRQAKESAMRRKRLARLLRKLRVMRRSLANTIGASNGRLSKKKASSG